MIDDKEGFLDQTYIKYLHTLNDVKFSLREIDIIACLLNGRTPKGIASFLSVSPRTVETHIRNIMLKTDCHSREGIINFIEKKVQTSVLRKHYLNLLNDFTFKQTLQEIAKIARLNPLFFHIVYKEENIVSQSLARELEKHLKFAGITTSLAPQKKEGRIPSLIPREDNHLNEYFLIVDPNEGIMQIQQVIEKQNNVILIFLNKETNFLPLKEIENIACVDFSEPQKYFDKVFEILKKIINNSKIDKLISQFNEQYVPIQKDDTVLLTPLQIEKKQILSNNNFYKQHLKNLNKGFLGSVAAFLCVALMSLWIGKEEIKAMFMPSTKAIRSDLFLPTDTTLLVRTDLLSKIDKHLNRKQTIQVLALVGPGGAGKTTLARQYARKQQNSVAWEINAESKKNLINSFENLAHALSKTDMERKYLQEIERIKNFVEREQQLLSFVKEKLRTHHNWILIYNDVNDLTLVQSYIPQDRNMWGMGKVILTTRDNNISSNSYIDSTIQIGELTSTEKLTLFTKIMKNGDLTPISSKQKEQIKNFLSDLPSFPLDISIAAYYLKITQISYEKYLEYLKNYDDDFALIQENILKGTNSYSRTRYSVIVLSLKNLIKMNKDFEDLLLFVSLFNAQNIPRTLLDAHKGEVIVDSFIYNLKKYSFLINGDSNCLYSFPTLSTHKATQEISLLYFIKIFGLNQNNPYLHSILTTLKKYVDQIISEEDFSKMRLLVSHYEIFLNHPIFISDDQRVALKSQLGIIYFYLGDYSQSQKILEETLAYLNQDCSKNCFRLPTVLTHLGMVYRKFGDYEKARKLLETSIQLYHTKYPKNYVEIAQSLRYLGMIHKSLGNYEKAKELFEKSLIIHKSHLSQNHKGFAWSLGSLGVIYRKLGKYEKAKELLEQSLAVYKKNFPQNHGGLAWTLAHLGRVLVCLGNYEKAKELFEQSLMIYRTHLSKNNVRISWVLAPLGIAYGELGDYEKAKELLEQSLVIYGNNLPEDHISMAWTTAHLGVVYKGLEDYEKARLLLNKSLTNYEKHYGKNHIENARILIELGKLYFLEGDFKSAETLLTNSLNLFLQHQHPGAYVALEYLADLYIKKLSYATNEYSIEQSVKFKEQVNEYLRQAINIVENHFPANSSHIKRMRSKMVIVE